MKTNKILIIIVLLVICIGVICANEGIPMPKNLAEATIIDTQRDTLKGVQGMFLTINDIKPEIEKLGLSKQQLQTDIELKLRQNGIKLLTQEECRSTVGRPLLVIRVQFTIVPDKSILAYSLNLTFREDALLARDQTMYCLGVTTWESGYYGVISNTLIQDVRNKLKDETDIFINDYLAVNPPTKPIPPIDEKQATP